MKILLAADGSPFTKKALAFVVTHEGLSGPNDELVVLNVQTPVPGGVAGMVGSNVVADFHRDEAEKVLAPIREFLGRHKLPFRCVSVVGHAPDEIVKTARAEGSHMIVMGTRGYGVIGRVLMGSVAQKVVAQADVPVLLVQ